MNEATIRDFFRDTLDPRDLDRVWSQAFAEEPRSDGTVVRRLRTIQLDERCQTYLTRVEEGISERPDVQELVRAIEAQGPELPSGDELASEIERFLRNQ